MFQTCLVVGHLGRDPELRYTTDGSPVCGFSVATSRKWTDRNGQPQEKTTWFRVSVFGNQAEPCSRFLAKGRLVLVEGEVDVSSYTAQDGTPRASLELRARTVRFIDSRRDDTGDWAGVGSSTFQVGNRGGGRSELDEGANWPNEAPKRSNNPPNGEDEIPF